MDRRSFVKGLTALVTIAPVAGIALGWAVDDNVIVEHWHERAADGWDTRTECEGIVLDRVRYIQNHMESMVHELTSINVRISRDFLYGA